MHSLRRAEVADARAIAEVHVSSWRHFYAGIISQEAIDSRPVDIREDKWRQILGGAAPRSAAWVAEVDGGVVGFIHVQPSRDPDLDPLGTGEVSALYLAPEAAGAGIGRGLLDSAADEMRGLGFRGAALWVLTANDRARRFYERSGWRADGAEKDCFGGTQAPAVRYTIEL